MLPTKKLKRTVPLLLDTPAALAHTVYQTLIFDGSVRDGGFEMQRTWEGRERSKLIQEEEQQKARSKRQKAEDAKLVSTLVEWEGLSDVILGRKEWFDAWLAGEQRCKSLLNPSHSLRSDALRSYSRGQAVQRHDQFSGRMANLR